MIYVVLGMHKSGTTLVSQILHESGISMIEGTNRQQGYDAGQTYERQAVVDLNMAFLNWGNKTSLDVIPKEPVAVTQAQKEEMRAIIQACDDQHANWGFKDPRTCLTYESWLRELPSHRVVAIYRNYREVLQHYKPSNSLRFPYFKAKNALKAWIHYNERLLGILHHTKSPFVLLCYGDLMTKEPEFGRLSDFVGLPLKDSRSPRLYRNRSNDRASLPFVMKKVVDSMPRNPDQLMMELDQLSESNGFLI
jgi:hypothetical protein